MPPSQYNYIVLSQKTAIISLSRNREYMKNIFRQLFVLVILGCCTPGIFAEDVKLFEETDNETTIDSIPSFGKFTYQTVFPPEMLNMDDTQNFYFDWGTILRGRLISFVSVDMTFNYEGKEFRVYETRAYPVDYGYDPGFAASYYHNPPHDVVINFYNPLRYDLEKYYGGDPSRVP